MAKTKLERGQVFSKQLEKLLIDKNIKFDKVVDKRSIVLEFIINDRYGITPYIIFIF